MGAATSKQLIENREQVWRSNFNKIGKPWHLTWKSERDPHNGNGIKSTTLTIWSPWLLIIMFFLIGWLTIAQLAIFQLYSGLRDMVLNTTFNIISVISWRSVPGENHRPVASHWQTLSHYVCIEYTSPWVGFKFILSNTTTMRSRNERRDGSTGSTKFDSSVGLSSGTFTSTQMFYLIDQDRVNWLIMYINVREYRRGNQKWKIQRNWQHSVHKTGKKHKKTTAQLCWTPLYNASKHKYRK